MGQKIEAKRIALIVEDNAELRTLAATLLEEAEFEVVEVGSGEEALHYLYHHAEEVAFLFADVRLPYLLSGVDLAHRVQLKWPWIRTVLTSGAPLEGDLYEAPKDVQFMPKPWRALDVLVEAEKAAKAHPL